ncbi:P2X purinoceptor 4-like [Corticium candelabrum]|uniref:P2X purinoceptor 4-like n=1 Tax=Corticium candelabrum TaxID=121492 RepID=UPI002E254D2A|nr:P2X purinoceptor 4-like [Corticium candelabrum]
MGNRCLGCVQATSSAAFEYDTVKLVHIRNQKIGFVYRLVQLAIVGYILGYVIVYQKGYQDTDLVVSSVTTKMKGTAMASDDQLWDVADYVVPPEETNAVFVTTNAVITSDQTQSICGEDIELAPCQVDSDCQENVYVRNGNGIQTGLCNMTTNSCEIRAWCPVENDTLPDPPLLGDAPKNFTLLIKNSIEFQKFDFTKRNILDRTDKNFLASCTYDDNDSLRQFCPIFVLAQTVADANANWSDLALNGGVMGIFIDWNCDLDKGYSDCVPDYHFRRMDKSDSKLAKGYSFRYPVYYMKDDVQYRRLVKAYGIRFEVIVSGEAGKFSIVPLLLNIGSGIALLSIATVICDLMVMYIVKKRQYYKENKYQLIEDEESLFPLDVHDGDHIESQDSEKKQLNAANSSHYSN